MSFVAALAFAVLAPAPRPVTLITSFSDGNFIDAPTGPWTYTTYVTDARAHPASVHQSSGGNPNDYREDTILFDNPPKSYSSTGVILALNANATWTPTSSPTAFTYLTFTCDNRWHLGSWGGHWTLVEQGGKYYIGPAEVGVGASWANHTSGHIAATDLNELNMTTLQPDPSSHPDFVSGSTITFGYALWGNHNGPGVIQGIIDIDNWVIELYRL